MRVVLASAGSRGDVFPILEVAARLQGRGHDVMVFVPPHFKAEARRRDLSVGFFSTDSQALMRSIDGGIRSARQILAWAKHAMLDQFDTLLPATADADALVTMVNELGAPAIAEYRRIPHFRVCCVPSLMGDQPPAVQPLQRLPAVLNRMLWRGVDMGTFWLFGSTLNAKRRDLGLSEVRRFSDYVAGSSHNLLAMDPVLNPPASGWRHLYRYVGYPFGGDDEALSPAIQEFLAAGPRPIYVGFGSVCLPGPSRTAQLVLSAVSQVGCRVILDAGWAGLGRGLRVPSNILLVDSAPHRRLFPRMAGLVHHGGSGTTHSAARAGVPQAVVPYMLDQFFWGERVRHLGLGPAPVPEAKLTADRLAAVFRELLGSTYRHQASVVAGLMRKDGVESIADVVESSVAGDRNRSFM